MGIHMYVLCNNCHLPEIDMVVNKKGLVVATCKACGWNGELDNVHKLATYISKNPPSSGIGFDADGKGGKKSKEDKRAAKLKKQQGGEDDDANSYQSEDSKEQKDKK